MSAVFETLRSIFENSSSKYSKNFALKFYTGMLIIVRLNLFYFN